MPNVSVMIKPASSGCDLDCRYCFYSDEAKHRKHAMRGIMSEETADLVIQRAFEFSGGGGCSFVFQGGEPSLAGLSFFEHFVDTVKASNSLHSPVSYSFQTNGLHIDDSWAMFFSRHDFLVGVSIDGIAAVHDAVRTAPGGGANHAAVLESLRCLRRFHVKFNTLSVVTKQLAQNIQASYELLKQEGVTFQQYIPCMEPLETHGKRPDYSLTPKMYGKFLHRLFSLWKSDLMKGRYISIRHFDNWMGIALGRAPESCNMRGICSPQFVVESDGSVYPCDFYCLDEWLLGNVRALSFEEMLGRSCALGFIDRSVAFIPEECRQCPWYSLCRNGCPRDRDSSGKTRYCDAHRVFFGLHARDISEAARLIIAKDLQVN